MGCDDIGRVAGDIGRVADDILMWKQGIQARLSLLPPL